MRIGSRRSFLKSSDQIQFDPSAEAYFSAAGITDLAEKIAANDFIVKAKADGFWSILERIYLVSPTDSTAALVCCKSLTSMTNVNSVAWSTSGFQTNYVDNYLDSNFSMSDTASINPLTVSHGYSLKDVTWSDTTSALAVIGGVLDSFNTKPMWLFCSDAASDTIYGGTGPGTTTTATSLQTGKTFTHHVYHEVITESFVFPNFNYRFSLYFDGVQNGTATNSTSSLLADNPRDFYFGALNNAGSPIYVSGPVPAVTPIFNFIFIGAGLGVSQAANVYAAASAYNTALGR